MGHHMVLKEQRTGGIANVPQEVDSVLTVLLKKKMFPNSVTLLFKLELNSSFF